MLSIRLDCSTEDGFTCDDKTCATRCNGEAECPFGADEAGCEPAGPLYLCISFV